MRIIEVLTGDEKEAEIVPVSKEQLKEVKREGRFVFDWEGLSEHEVVALKMHSHPQIMGLMAIETVPTEGFKYVEIKALECSKENVGEAKEYDLIAGCLIAHACRASIARGCEGYVTLVPKTKLINHYHDKYGFEHTGMAMMFSDTDNSVKLMQEYPDD